jgi:hypothetical protein
MLTKDPDSDPRVLGGVALPAVSTSSPGVFRKFIFVA